jgi:hypothetical protein
MAKRAEILSSGILIRDEQEIQKKLKEWNISREEYDRLQTVKLERESKVAPVGAMAPDFELERLSPQGDRTGETTRLSSFRGRPVALAFGSYT